MTSPGFNRTNVIAVRRFLTASVHHRPTPIRAPARMALYPEEGTGRAVYIPYAPVEVNHNSLAASWSEVNRPGLPNALLYSNQPLPKLAFNLFIVDKVIRMEASRIEGGTYQTATDLLNLLRRYAEAGTKMRLAYSTMESGAWRITDMSFNSLLRDPVTDEITRAELSIELTRVSDITAGIGPVSGGVQQPAVPSAPLPTPPATTRYYKVVKGDTLWAISIKFYKTGFRWREIADTNGVTDPRKLQVGKVLRIP